MRDRVAGDAPRGGDPVEPGHADVHQDHVGPVLRPARWLSRHGLTDDRRRPPIRAGVEATAPGPIVGKEDADHGTLHRATTRNPPVAPGRERPPVASTRSRIRRVPGRRPPDGAGGVPLRRPRRSPQVVAPGPIVTVARARPGGALAAPPARPGRRPRRSRMPMTTSSRRTTMSSPSERARSTSSSSRVRSRRAVAPDRRTRRRPRGATPSEWTSVRRAPAAGRADGVQRPRSCSRSTVSGSRSSRCAATPDWTVIVAIAWATLSLGPAPGERLTPDTSRRSSSCTRSLALLASRGYELPGQHRYERRRGGDGDPRSPLGRSGTRRRR